MAAEWFCEISGKQFGPLSSQQLRALVEKGRLTPEHLVRQGTEGAWVPAARLKGLFRDDGASAAVSESAELLVAKPVKEPDVKKAKSAPPRAVKPLNLPVAQEAPQPPAAPAPRSQAPPPRAAAAPPPVTARPASSPSRNLVTEASSRFNRVTGRDTAGPVPLGRKRRKNTVAVVLLAVLVLGLGTAGIVLMWLDRDADDSSGKSDSQMADAEKEVEPSSSDSGDSKQPPNGPPEPEWVDASKQSAKAGDVKVRVASVQRGYPDFSAYPSSGKPGEECLMIAVELQSTSSTRKVDYTGWGGRSSHRATLSDNFKNKYTRPKSFGRAVVKGQVATASLYADRPVRDLLVFELPVPKAEFLLLELPGAAFGQRGQVLRFKIPKEMIGVTVQDLVREPRDDEPITPDGDPFGDDMEDALGPAGEPEPESDEGNDPRPAPDGGDDDEEPSIFKDNPELRGEDTEDDFSFEGKFDQPGRSPEPAGGGDREGRRDRRRR